MYLANIFSQITVNTYLINEQINIELKHLFRHWILHAAMHKFGKVI